MKQLLSRGTNGKTGYTPEGGALQAGSSFRSWRNRSVTGVETRILVYLVALATGALGLAGAAVAQGYSVGSVWVVAVLSAAALISERQRVWLRRETHADGISASISLIPILFAAVLFGPLSAAVVAAVSMLSMLERPYIKWSVYTCTRSIGGTLSGFAAAASSAWPSGHLAGLVVGAAVGGLVAECSETAFVGLTMKLRDKDPLAALRTLAPLAFASVLLYAPLVAL